MTRAKFTSEGSFPDWSEGVDRELRRHFPDYDYKGVMVDVGAWEHERASNSWHFYNSGWTVISVEGNPHRAAELREHRQNVVEAAAWDRNEDLTFCVNPSKSLGGDGAHSTVKKFYPSSKARVEVEVVGRTLDDILSKDFPHIEKVDILSVDVERSEPAVMNGFDFNRWRPKVVVVEVHTPDRRGRMRELGYKELRQLNVNTYYLREE
jgi:FkbM family methyltransferase